MKTKPKHAKAKRTPEKFRTVADFKAHIASMFPRLKPEEKTYSALVRKPTDRGYYPPNRNGGNQ
jgi:hypothetical protein